MATRTITTKLALDGEAEYRAKIKNINAELALHKSELAKVKAQYQDSSNSLSALEATQSAMQSQLAALNEKHEEQAAMVKKAQAAYQKYAQEAESLRAQQEELKNSSSASAEEEKKLSDAISAAEDQMKQAANSVTFYQKALNTTERDQANLSAELKQTKSYLDEAKTSITGCAHSIDQYGKEVKDAGGISAEYRSKIASLDAEFALHKSQMEKVQAQYKNQANSTEALGAKCSALKDLLADLDKKHGEQADMLEKAQKAYQKYTSEVEALEAKQNDLKNSTENSAEAEKQLQEELDAAKANMDKAASSVTFYQKQLNLTERDQANLGAELQQTKDYLDEAKSSTDGCATSIDQYGKKTKEVTSAIDSLAQAIVAAGLAEKVKDVAAALYGCVDTFGAFQSQMSAVQAISGATSEDMAALADKAREMGATTSFTAAEAGQALEYMAMAGWKTGDMLDGLEGVMHLAAASGESLASTSDIVTDALTAFGLKASDSGHFADVLAAASSNANTNVAMMGETFQYAAPVAGALGYSIEDVALAVGLMANAGIKGSQSGTALRTMLTNLAKPSKDVSEYMEALGVSLTDSEGRMLSLSGLLGQLRDRFADLSEAEQAEYAAGIAGKEAMSGLLAVVNASEADYRKLAEAIGDCSNASYEMSQTRLDNYAGQVTLLNSAVDGLKLAVGEQLEPVLRNLASGATDAVTGVTELLETCPALVPILSGLVASAGALAAAFAGFTIVKSITPMLTAFNAALAANPAGAVAVGVVGLISALTVLSAQCENAGAEAQALTKSLQDSRAAYEELSASMEEERSSVTASIRALEGLLEVEGKSSAEKEVILRKVEELNEKIPGLSLAYDEAADAINMTNDALERMAESAGAQEEQEARVERLNQLYNEQEALEKELAETKERLAEAMADAQWDSFGGAMNDSAAAVGQLQEAEAALNAALEEHAAELSELKEAAIAYNEQQAESATQTEEAAAKMEALTNEALELEAAYRASYDAALESIRGQVGLFQEMDGSAKTSIDNLIETLKGQVDYMETYNENIKRAMEMGVDEGLVQKLSDGSEKSAQILAAIVQGGTEDIEELNEQLSKVEEGKENFANTIAEMETEFKKKMEALSQDMKAMVKELELKEASYKAGWNNIQGLIDGTASQKRALVEKYTEMGKAAIAAYKKAVDQHSPSRKFREAGSYDIRGIIEGAEAEKARLDAAYREMAQTALESMRRGMPSTFVEPRSVSQEDQTAAIAAAIKSLRSEIPAQSGQGLPFSQADLAAALREALSGLSVNMNQRKVGELVTDWQKNNDRSRGV